MKALILMSHGSRNSMANQEVIDLTHSVGLCAKQKFVAYAFLDVLKPTLDDSIEQMIEKGATQIDVLPLFLNTGNHVAKDIPHMIIEARKRHPHVILRLLRHIGAHPAYVQLVNEMAHTPEHYLTLD